jgi:CRP/FNR family transcriptional regulator, anaerobic regulatory protein
MDQQITQQFRNLFEKELLDEMTTLGKIVQVHAGDVIMETGQYVKFIPLIISGTIKVMRTDEEGSEILLYYIGSNETCAMSLTCCLAHQKSRVRVVAEEETELFTLPVSKMDEWMLKYPSWKNYVMQTYSARFDELLRTIDSVAFHKVDERLVKYLLDKASLTGDRIVLVSHQQIAEELNSSREVISRLLKQLERNHKIKLGRNRIEILSL